MKHLLFLFNNGDFSQYFLPEHFYFLPIVIKIALVFIVISVFMILNIQLRIINIRYREHRYKKRMKRIIPKIDDLLTETVFMNEQVSFSDPVDIENAELDLTPFQIPLFLNKRNRQILIDRMVNYKLNFTGNIGILLRKLYLDLRLDAVSLKKLNSHNSEKKIQGINELEVMDVPISDALILPMTNSRHHELRAKARQAYIKLSKNEPFKFFDVSTEPLLRWDQIELFRTITNNDKIPIPNFARWVAYSNNKSVISFCLKLIVHFNQADAMPSVFSLLDHKDHKLRLEAINCLGKMRYDTAEDKLIHIYTNQPLKCQLAILEALGDMETEKNVSFLKQEFLYSSDFEIRKEAAKSLLKTVSPDAIDELKAATSAENIRILNHCMNPLINI